MDRVPVLLVLGLLVAPTLAPAVAAMSQAEFEETLAAMQADVRLARERYVDGDVDGAVEAAERVAGQFDLAGKGASDLELKIKEASAISIGDRVKGLSAQLLNAVRSDAGVEAVDDLVADLEPSLNRLVLIAEGRVSPASQRQLRTPEDVDSAVDDVRDLVQEALDLHAEGAMAEAEEVARDSFFTFEVNGVGPDTSTVDDDLENYAENLLIMFDASRAESEPGLAQLIERGASREAIEGRAEEAFIALEEIRDLLKATLPPLNLGDANGDGRVNIVDALLTAQAALGIVAKTGEMDVNGDGAVTVVDALFIAQAALGIRRL